MTEAQKIDRILLDLALPRGQWVLTGSGVMVLHGIERKQPLSDLDIFCSTRLWFDLLFADIANEHMAHFLGLMSEDRNDLDLGWHIYTTSPKDPARKTDPPYLYKDFYGLEVNLFFGWRSRDFGNIDVNFAIESAEEIAGWPCMRLSKLLAWKQAATREKDQADIQAIKQHLAKDPVLAVK